MKITYDSKADAAYIDLRSDGDGYAVSYTYCCDPLEAKALINLDFDASGKLVGIEVLEAAVRLPQSLLQQKPLEE